MDVREFTNRIREELPAYLPDDMYRDVVIEPIEVAKMNDQLFRGITIYSPIFETLLRSRL